MCSTPQTNTSNSENQPQHNNYNATTSHQHNSSTTNEHDPSLPYHIQQETHNSPTTTTSQTTSTTAANISTSSYTHNQPLHSIHTHITDCGVETTTNTQNNDTYQRSEDDSSTTIIHESYSNNNTPNPQQTITTFHKRQQWPKVNDCPVTISLGTFNTQGNYTKHSKWIADTIHNYQIDIMLLQEINGKGKNHRYTAQQTLDTDEEKWDSFWAPANNKHSNGVGILMKQSISKFKGKVEVHKDRSISILMYLPRNAKLRITNIYWPANANAGQEKRQLTNWLLNLIAGDDINTEQIVGGDWNTALHPPFDRYPARHAPDNDRDIIQEIMDTCELMDIYRILNPTQIQMTHLTIRHNMIANASRIDYFLTSRSICDRTIQADTLVSDDVPTDHRPTFIEIRWTAWASTTRRSRERRIPDIKEADEEDLEGFRKAMEREGEEIAGRLGRTRDRLGTPHLGNLAFHQEQADRWGIMGPGMEDRLWSEEQRSEMRQATGRALRSLHEAIIRNAQRELPQRIVGKEKSINKQTSATEKSKKFVGSIRQLLHNNEQWPHIQDKWQQGWHELYTECTTQNLSYPDPTYFPTTTTYSTPAHTAELPILDSLYMRQLWYRQLGHLYRVLEQQVHATDNINRIKRIEEATTARNEKFKDNVKACLDSILERRGQRIVIDRAQKTTAEGTTVITYDEEEVKVTMKETYDKWLGPEGFRAPEPGTRLAKEYGPKAHIQEEWYRDVDKDTTIDDIREALEEMGKNKATGPSGVSRELILLAGDRTLGILKDIVNMCLWMKDVPDEMGRVVIVAIPKSAEWGGNPWKTRPISLMEVTHKLLEHILTRRLQNIEQQHPTILQGYNFGCRMGYSTDDALHVLNNIIDYANW